MTNDYNDVIALSHEWKIEMDGLSDTYLLLYSAAQSVVKNDIPGLICEIGVRMGYGIFTMMCSAGNARTYVGIDPYGDIEISTHPGIKHGYNLKMKNKLLSTMYSFCEKNDIDYIHMPMESTEFISRFSDGVPIYDGIKNVQSQYSLIHVDGVHSTEMVLEESKFFVERLSPGGYISYDNWDFYNNDPINEYLSTKNVRLVGIAGHKNMYRRDE